MRYSVPLLLLLLLFPPAAAAQPVVAPGALSSVGIVDRLPLRFAVVSFESLPPIHARRLPGAPRVRWHAGVVSGSEEFFVDATWSPSPGWPTRYLLGMRVPLGERLRFRLGGGLGFPLRRDRFDYRGLWPIMPLVATGLLTGGDRVVLGAWVVFAHQKPGTGSPVSDIAVQMRFGVRF